MCVAALIGYLAFPTYPTYDSFYALLWGRDLLHAHLPDLQVYRAPTEHPLAIAFGMLCSIFGQGGARLMVLGSIVSFVAAVAGIYRSGGCPSARSWELVAALLLLSRFFVENLAAQGYLDISYLALILWALALELERRRRGPAVFVLLAAAGLLRPDAWVLSGVYWLWCCWPGLRPAASPRREPSPRRMLAYLGLAAIAPLLWLAFDAIVTGDPLYSLTATAGLAQELERTQGFSSVLGSVWSYSVRIDHLPVLLGAIAGPGLALLLTPRRAIVPLAALVLLYAVYIARGRRRGVGDRPLPDSGRRRSRCCSARSRSAAGDARAAAATLRRGWIAFAVVLVAYGTASAANTISLSSLRTTLAEHEDFHQGLAAALHNPRVAASLRRCPLLSLPNNKLIPDARWILDSVGQHDIVARSQARSDAHGVRASSQQRLKRGSVAVYPLGSAVFSRRSWTSATIR